MKRALSLCTLVLLALGTGCGKRPVQRAPQPEPTPAAFASPRTESKSEYRSAREENANPYPGPLRAERPKITFTYVESCHVRMPGVNPLSGSGLLTLPLAELAAEYCPPHEGKFLSPFGPRGNSYHTGIDIKAVPGDTIRAALPGVVRMSRPYSGYGNIVVIRHYCGLETVYAHQTRNLVEVNDAVEAGDPIGLAGRTGRATTEHLHFEVRAAGDPIDPARMVDPLTMRLRADTLFIRSAGGRIIAYNSTEEGRLLTGEIEQNPAIAILSYGPDAKPAAASSVKAEGAQKPGEAQYYRVKKGDTLSQIARNHRTTVDALCRLNRISRHSTLQINQRLRIK